ncbi:serine hydroxymethyltransferase, mitochondrial-like protein, partial [Tanacetum coccineum]
SQCHPLGKSPLDYSRKYQRTILEPWRQSHGLPPSPHSPLPNRTTPTSPILNNSLSSSLPPQNSTQNLNEIHHLSNLLDINLQQTDMKKILVISIFFETMRYRLDEITGYIDYEQMDKSDVLFRLKLVVASASTYARVCDYARMRKICKKQKAIILVDMAHIRGLAVVGVIPSLS